MHASKGDIAADDTTRKIEDATKTPEKASCGGTAARTGVVQNEVEEVEHNPFLMLSDFPFKAKSRFPIDSRKALAGENAIKEGSNTKNTADRNSVENWKEVTSKSNVTKSESAVKVSTNNSFSLLSNENSLAIQEDRGQSL